MAKTPLQVRHAAALKLVEAGELDGVLALSLVDWPPKGSGTSTFRSSGSTTRLSLGRRSALATQPGETLPELGRKMGIPWTSIECICSAAERSAGPS